MREIDKIIIHCSASKWGNAEIIDSWHRDRGFAKIGYHFVIDNCYPDYERFLTQAPESVQDGFVEPGRPVSEIGAHVYGHNKKSIGICLIGDDVFSGRQLISLYRLVKKLEKDLGKLEIYGHYEFNLTKTCPNINATWLREYLHGNS